MALGNFERSKPFKEGIAALQAAGVPMDQIVQRHAARRNSPAIIRVHPLLALEFIRWADYPAYAKQIIKRFTA